MTLILLAGSFARHFAVISPGNAPAVWLVVGAALVLGGLMIMLGSRQSNGD